MSLPPTPPSMPGDGDARDKRKALVLSRVNRQRDVWQSRRAAAAGPSAAPAAAAATAAAAAAVGAAAAAMPPPGVAVAAVPAVPGGFPRSITMRLLMQHPALAVGAVALALAIGPSRLLRTAGWVLPVVLRRD